MPLISLWNSNPDAVGQLTIEQIVATADDGNLRDGSECAEELRTYISEVLTHRLAGYVDHCLSSSFTRGGMVLQDLVNEIGRRLDYEVTNGRYQGTAGAIGFDGLWRSPEGNDLVVEVKTTDAYRVSLDTIAGYRQKLTACNQLSNPSSILIVVGRQDTGELEAQIRGSRHAWDIRLISIEALLKLLQVKENSNETETGAKIRSLFAPVEYTRLDRMVDVVFTAAPPTLKSFRQPMPNLSTVARGCPRSHLLEIRKRRRTSLRTAPCCKRSGLKSSGRWELASKRICCKKAARNTGMLYETSEPSALFQNDMRAKTRIPTGTLIIPNGTIF